MNKDITPHNNKHQRHGYWEYYLTEDGDLLFKCFYHNDKPIDYAELYSSDTIKVYKSFYII